MFLDFYGLREQPFGVTPDPRYLYLSVGHREALASLIYGVESGRGFMALVAKPGMGKTTLLFQLLERLRSSAQTVFLFQTQCESREFLRYILADLGFDTREQDLVTLHRQFNEVLIREKRAGKRFVLAIDEAQNLNESVLETIRLLSDFETPRDKLMQIIVAGQPQLAQKLALPSLAQLRQRVSMLVRLNPFTPQETVSCVEHRLRVAGYTGGPLFTPEAQAIIAARSEGIPRNIVNLCFHALSLGCALERKIIDTEIVQEVLADLDVGTLVSAPPDALEPVGAPEQSFETVLTTPIAFDAVGPEAVAGSGMEVPASAALEEAVPAVEPVLAPDALVSAVEPEAVAGFAMEVPGSVSLWRRLFLRWSRRPAGCALVSAVEPEAVAGSAMEVPASAALEEAVPTVASAPAAEASVSAVEPEAVAGSGMEVPASAALEDAVPAVEPAPAADALVSTVEPEAVAGSGMEVPASAALEEAVSAVEPALAAEALVSAVEPEALAVAEIETLPIATVEPVPLPMASAAAELEAVSAAMAHLPGALRGQEGRGAGLAVWARLLPDALSGTFQRWPLWISAVGVLLAWGAGFWFFSGGVARKTSLPTSPDSRSTVKAVVSEPPLAGTGELSSKEPPTVAAKVGVSEPPLVEAGELSSKEPSTVAAKVGVSEPPLAETGELSSKEPPTVVVKVGVSEPPLAETSQLSSEEQLTVIVETGQTLRQICLRYLGRFDSKSLNSVHALNPWLVDPDDIKVGQLVRLPRLSALSKRENVAAKQGAEFKATPKAKP